MQLSILICSLVSRELKLTMLLRELEKQSKNLPVEILWHTDNKEITTGAKRNLLLQAAKGKYIIFIDDDDWIEPYYVDELLIAAESDADCFAIKGWITTNGQNKMEWRLSKDYENVTIKESGRPIYLRTTNHITAVKREIALKGMFPDKSNAEDKEYSIRINPYLKTEYVIDKYLYFYRFSTHNKDYT